MKLSKAIEAYIAHKRSLGMSFRSDAVRLRAFVKSVGDGEIRQVRPQAVRRFLDGQGPVTSFWFSKYHSLTAFYRYAIARHYVEKSPLPRSTPQKPEKFLPYIYTNDDMKKLIDAADSRHRSDWLLTPDTVRTLLLLLYGTGLRISEPGRLRSRRRRAHDSRVQVLQEPFRSHRLRPTPGTRSLHRPTVATSLSRGSDAVARNGQASAHYTTDCGTGL